MEKENLVFIPLKNEELRALVFVGKPQKWKRGFTCAD